MLVLCFIAGGALPAIAETPPANDEQQEQVVGGDSRDSPDPGVAHKEECEPDDRRCKMDRRLDELEGSVRDAHGEYKKGEMWKLPKDTEEEKPKKTKYGTKALKDMALFPNYVIRLFTWPVTAAADGLIKTGAIRTLIDVVSNDERTFWVYPKIEMGFGDGFGGGVGVRHFDLAGKGYDFSASYVIHINLNQEAHVSIGKDNAFYIGRTPVHFKAGSWLVHYNTKDYYGIGAETLKSNQASFGGDGISTGGWIGFGLFKDASMRAHLYFDFMRSEPGSSTPSVQQVFPPPQLPAFGVNLHYINAGADFVHDDRDSDIMPSKGGYRQVSFSHFERVDGRSFDYNQVDLDVVQFLPFWRPRHMFVLRTAWRFQFAPKGGIPFYRLAKLDVDSPLRSYDWGRFRDRSSAVFNAEYRFPVWMYLDGQLFFDAGRVFDGVTDFSFKHIKYSAGVGIRFRTKDYFLMRLQFAYGGEGGKFLFKTSQAF